MAINDVPRTRRYLKDEALSAVRAGRTGEGITKYLEYLSYEENKNDDDAWAGLGGAYRRVGNIAEAIDSYQEAYDINSKSTYALVNLVCLLKAQGDEKDRIRLREYAEQAERLCREAIDSRRADYWTWYDLATVQLVAGKISDSQATFTYAAELTPKDAKENFRSVLTSLKFLKAHNPKIAGIDAIIEQIESYLT